MANIWSTEARAIILALSVLAALGLISGSWLFASLVTLGAYIAWLYHRLLKLERWIRAGSRTSQLYRDGGFFDSIIRLLHEQKESSSRRKKRTKRLLRRLKQNIAALPDATVLLNRDFQIEWCNEPARQLLNLRSPQDLGYRISNLIRDPLLAEYLESPDRKTHIEMGSPIDPDIVVQVRIVSYGDDQLLLIARNISEQKQFQQSMKNFVANASHELRSPLTVIAGHLEMLENESRISDTGQRSLAIAQRQAERMKELIQGLLLLSQVESYRLAPDEGERIALPELMTGVMAALDKYDDVERVELRYPEQLCVIGVKIEIEGICINLVENAIKYSTPGLPIEVSWAESCGGRFVFSVVDRGPGIDAADIPNLTRRYYRGARSRAETIGSGLGLAIVQHAANKHGAEFDIESHAGRGSRFSVSFPAYRGTYRRDDLDGVARPAAD